MGWFSSAVGGFSHAVTSATHVVTQPVIGAANAVNKAVVKPVLNDAKKAAEFVAKEGAKVEHAAESVVQHVAADARTLEKAGLKVVDTLADAPGRAFSDIESIGSKLGNFMPMILAGAAGIAIIYVYANRSK